MNTDIALPPSTDRVMAMIRGELSSPRRWFYRGVLLAASVGLAAILSLWMTEPGPLPLRLHIAFGALSAIAMSWIGVLTWILWRQRCPTALDRIATGWVATGACTLFLVVALPIAAVRGDAQSALCLAAFGLTMWGIAAMMLRGAYSLRTQLRAKLVELGG
jgi:hypothetical protein